MTRVRDNEGVRSKNYGNHILVFHSPLDYSSSTCIVGEAGIISSSCSPFISTVDGGGIIIHIHPLSSLRYVGRGEYHPQALYLALLLLL